MTSVTALRIQRCQKLELHCALVRCSESESYWYLASSMRAASCCMVPAGVHIAHCCTKEAIDQSKQASCNSPMCIREDNRTKLHMYSWLRADEKILNIIFTDSKVEFAGVTASSYTCRSIWGCMLMPVLLACNQHADMFAAYHSYHAQNSTAADDIICHVTIKNQANDYGSYGP